MGSRIVVVGTTGSGKTTSAKKLAQRLRLRHVELDALFWKPGWGETPDSCFLTSVEGATQGDRWIVDGNYSRTRSIVWPRADTLVWLDYRFSRVFQQLLLRSVRRSVTRETLWRGCQESLRRQFLSRDSILLWCLKTYRTRRRNYPIVLERPEYAHLDVHRFRTPQAFERWLGSLSPPAGKHDEEGRQGAPIKSDMV